MQAAGFVAPLEEHWKYCPYCGKSLGKLEVMKRVKRPAKCEKFLCQKSYSFQGFQPFLTKELNCEK